MTEWQGPPRFGAALCYIWPCLFCRWPAIRPGAGPISRTGSVQIFFGIHAFKAAADLEMQDA
ncbi:hypothetical protein, partial [Glutamicibacter soli]|uniref:hypothetical protein n=1 Tax=Glutamicibacter soli TaxID=453836 RepID=UPI001F2AA1A8